MSDTLSDLEKPPVITTSRLIAGVVLFVALASILAQRVCFDVPIQTPIDLEHKGVPIFQTITFRQPRQGYAYGIAFTPSFVGGRDWLFPGDSEAEMKKAWAELSPTLDIAIIDSSGSVKMREISRISSAAGWTMTNSSQEDRPASVYKFITFKPVAGEHYQVRVFVIKGCAGSNARSPVFFIEMPTATL